MSPIEQYNSIIYFRQQYPLVKGECHHIIPKSLGGCNKKWNLVRLTPEEHIECHRLLTLIYATGEEHKRMCGAYACMLTTRKGVKVSPEEAARAHAFASEAAKGTHPKGEWKPGNVPWNKGMKMGPSPKRGTKASEETRRRQSERKKQNPVRYWLGKEGPTKGRHLTEEDKQKKREAALRRWAKVKGNN